MAMHSGLHRTTKRGCHFCEWQQFSVFVVVVVATHINRAPQEQFLAAAHVRRIAKLRYVRFFFGLHFSIVFQHVQALFTMSSWVSSFNTYILCAGHGPLVYHSIRHNNTENLFHKISVPGIDFVSARTWREAKLNHCLAALVLAIGGLMVFSVVTVATLR